MQYYDHCDTLNVHYYVLKQLLPVLPSSCKRLMSTQGKRLNCGQSDTLLAGQEESSQGRKWNWRGNFNEYWENTKWVMVKVQFDTLFISIHNDYILKYCIYSLLIFMYTLMKMQLWVYTYFGIIVDPKG